MLPVTWEVYRSGRIIWIKKQKKEFMQVFFKRVLTLFELILW